MTYTLAIVDEGLLDLTRFKTPDPWDHFYAREALGVRTWDLYDDVIGAFGRQLTRVLALGGSDDAGPAKGAKANRFKPVVRFVGPFTVTKGKKAKHSFTIDNYVGPCRVMVVASDGAKAYGNAEKTVPVRKPLMVLATMPRVLAPGELVDLPVTVFAMDAKVKDVVVKLEPNALLIPEGPCRKHDPIQHDRRSSGALQSARERSDRCGQGEGERGRRRGKGLRKRSNCKCANRTYPSTEC